jgi:HK97 family phage prohead protease
MQTKQYETIVKTQGDNRRVAFTISTKSVDRSGDRVLGPIDVTNYRKNNVVLWGHDYQSVPIVSISQQGDGLVAVAEFAGAELSEFADKVYRLLKGGYLRAASIGFRPIDTPKSNSSGGVDFGRCELLEFSIVSVPANPEALSKSAAGQPSREVSEPRARQLIEQAVDRASLATPSPSEAAEIAAFITQLDRLDTEALRSLVSLL